MKLATEAQSLKPGDRVDPQGLVIAVQRGYAKTKVTFKDSNERLFPNTQVVYVVVVEVLPLPIDTGAG